MSTFEKTAKTILFGGCVIFALTACGKFENQTGEWASGAADDSASAVPETPRPVTPPTSVGAPSTPASVDFMISRSSSTIAHGVAKTWNGCDHSQVVTGGFDSDTKCGSGYFLPAFADHLNGNFMTCVDKAAVVADYPRPERVFLRHLGTYVNRNGRGSTELSMHAFARAIDIAKFILYDKQGTEIQVVNSIAAYKGANAKFYDSFRECWKQSISATCRPGQRESNGSIGHAKSALGGNSLHNGHIHLSFPPCAG
jgi:hypothetical protein